MPSPLDRIARAAAELAEADRRLHDDVAAARAGGATWQQIAEVLGVTRQAAFKRFGTPVDPETGERLAVRSGDAGAVAARAFELLARGRAEQVRLLMTQACARSLTHAALTEVWHDVLAQFGELERCANPTNHAADGALLGSGSVPLPAVGRVDLVHEAGETYGHVTVNRDGRITGMTIRPAGVPESWPL